MLLYFLRHGDASSSPQINDSDRPLTEVGIHQATLVGTFLQQIEMKVDIILSSPLARAQQTASIIQEKIKTEQFKVCDYLLNGSDQHQLFEHLDSFKVSSILLVGHEPHLSETISLLIGSDRNAGIEIKKCSLALINASHPIQQGREQLRWLIPLETIQKLIPEKH